MATTINHTGRRKLDRKDYSIKTSKNSDGLTSFDLELALDDFSKFTEAKVVVEVNSSNIMQRFDFGRVADCRAPDSTVLDKLSATATPKFTVLLVDDSQHIGRILATGETKALIGETDGGSSLLVVTTFDLGELAWNIQINPGDRPELCLNQKIPDAIQLLKTDPEYQALILPAAFKEIMLTYYAHDNRDDDDEYQKLWWDLAETLGGEVPQEARLDEFINWLEGVILVFSKEHRFYSEMERSRENEKE